jgi:hypothetical protein
MHNDPEPNAQQDAEPEPDRFTWRGHSYARWKSDTPESTPYYYVFGYCYIHADDCPCHAPAKPDADKAAR